MSYTTKFDYTNRIEIGRGQFGRVYKAIDAKTGHQVIMKVTYKHTSQNVNITTERKILFKIKPDCRPYLICIINTFMDGDDMWMVFNLIPNVVDLYQLLWKSHTQLPLRTRIKIAINLINGLKVLHKNNIVHRDIKPNNLLTNIKYGSAHYIDYGLSCDLGDNSPDGKKCLRKLCGSPAYICPILFDTNYIKSISDSKLVRLLPRCDIYSLACVLYELLLSSQIPHLARHIMPPLNTNAPRLADYQQQVEPKLFPTLKITKEIIEEEKNPIYNKIFLGIAIMISTTMDRTMNYSNNYIFDGILKPLHDILGSRKSQTFPINYNLSVDTDGFGQAVNNSLNSPDYVCFKSF